MNLPPLATSMAWVTKELAFWLTPNAASRIHDYIDKDGKTMGVLDNRASNEGSRRFHNHREDHLGRQHKGYKRECNLREPSFKALASST